MKKVLSAVCLAAALALGGCSSGGDGSYRMDGSLTDNNITVAGIYAYIKLVTPGGGDAAPAIYWAKSTAFDATTHTATYAITGIAEGTYDGYIFVDLDGNSGGGAAAMPDSGDDGRGPDSFTFPARQHGFRRAGGLDAGTLTAACSSARRERLAGAGVRG